MMLNGYTLPHPQGYARKPVRASVEIELASTAVKVYRRGARGYRYSWVLSWTKVRPGALTTIEAACVVDEPMIFVDLNGVAWGVKADELPEVTYIAGTDPVLADVSLTVSETSA